MDFTQILGLVAGALTAFSQLPQVIKTWKTRDAAALSTKMLLLITAGVCLWLVYGVIKSDWPIIISNAVSVSLNAFLLLLKLRFRKRNQTKPAPFTPSLPGRAT